MQGNLQVRFGRRAIREKGQVTLVPRPAPYLASTAAKWGITKVEVLRQFSQLVPGSRPPRHRRSPSLNSHATMSLTEEN